MDKQIQMFPTTLLIAVVITLTAAILYLTVLRGSVSMVAIGVLSFAAVVVAAAIDIYHGHGLDW